MATVDLRHEAQWNRAQSISLGLDLVAAAKSQLRFLAAVDSYPHDLYRGPAVKRAIQRYEKCWLQLLAEHGSYTSSGLPLVPPIDCAWVWHCHRLNPTQYIKDCESLFGRLLDGHTVFDDDDYREAVKFTEYLWDTRFPEEKYEFENIPKISTAYSQKITYDLESAISRQSSFHFQVARPHMGEEKFLKVALQRYKGFLHLLQLTGLKFFLVPTYDIDLMWHSHQDRPLVYKEDMTKLLGKVLNHDDTDSDRTKGQKLDTGFNATRKFWQNTFGSAYERAGAMYRGEQILSIVPKEEPKLMMEMPTSVDMGTPTRQTMQVFVTVHGARNVHTSHEGTLAVQLSFQKKCNALKLGTPWITTTSNPCWESFFDFQCEYSTEGVRLELILQQENDFKHLTETKLLGYIDISWKTLINSPMLSRDGWVPLSMKSKVYQNCKPVSLQISISVTPPVMAPYLFCIDSARVHNENDKEPWIVLNHAKEKIFSIYLSGSCDFLPSSIQVHQYSVGNSSCELSSVLGSAKYLGKKDDATVAWSLLDDMLLFLKIDEHIPPTLHLRGKLGNSVRLFLGRKLQYQPYGTVENEETGFVTVVRYTLDAPRGKATALFNWVTGLMEVSSEENGILVVLLCTIISMSVHVGEGKMNQYWKKNNVKLSETIESFDDWGSVILTSRCSHSQMLPYYPWYSASPIQWMSFYNRRLISCQACATSGNTVVLNGCANASRKEVRKRCGCGGCGPGSCGNSIAIKTNSGRACGTDECGKWGEEITPFKALGTACGGCGAGGCGNSLSGSGNGHAGGGGCGGCGAGGCGNEREEITRVEALGTACGGCGAGGCGNEREEITRVEALGTACGGCGAGGCGNSLAESGNGHARGGGCGGCGAGACGNSLSGSGSGHARGGGCGAGSCGNSSLSGSGNGDARGDGCGGCGAGGCGNSLNGNGNGDARGGGCGGCGAGGCGNSLNGSGNGHARGGGCGGCGAGGCGNILNGSGNGDARGGGCGGCGAGGCGNSLNGSGNGDAQGGGCGGCGAGGCGNSLSGSGNDNAQGGGFGGCGGGGGCCGGCGAGDDWGTSGAQGGHESNQLRTSSRIDFGVGGSCGACGGGGGCGNSSKSSSSTSTSSIKIGKLSGGACGSGNSL